jgi:hypothetical protein
VYSLERADRFSVDPLTGEVVSTASFLGQAGTIFTLTAVARDLGGREGGLAATAKLIVSILPIILYTVLHRLPIAKCRHNQANRKYLPMILYTVLLVLPLAK